MTSLPGLMIMSGKRAAPTVQGQRLERTVEAGHRLGQLTEPSRGDSLFQQASRVVEPLRPGGRGVFVRGLSLVDDQAGLLVVGPGV